MATKLKKFYSANKALQFTVGKAEDVFTTDEWELQLFGGPDELEDMDKADLMLLNIGSNPYDYRIYVDYDFENKEEQPLDSRMALTKTGTVPAGTPPINNIVELFIDSPAHIKIYIKSTVDTQPGVAIINFKSRG